MLNKGAIWTYWEGAYRDTGRDEGATLVLQTGNKNGWFWYIPLHDNIVSVGVVAPFDYLFKGRGRLRADLRRGSRAAARASRSAWRTRRRVTGYFATKDYSYRSTQVAGDGWVLVGDAFGFLDPLYSSGVLLALKSGELAADAIVEGLARGRHVGGAARASGDRSSTRASIACGGSCASTTTASASATWCDTLSAPARHADRSADRRSVHRPRGQGVGADGVAVRARQAADSAVGCRHTSRALARQDTTSWCCPRGVGHRGARGRQLPTPP